MTLAVGCMLSPNKQTDACLPESLTEIANMRLTLMIKAISGCQVRLFTSSFTLLKQKEHAGDNCPDKTKDLLLHSCVEQLTNEIFPFKLAYIFNEIISHSNRNSYILFAN